MKPQSEIRELVEKHWQYTKKIIESATGRATTQLEHDLYVESGIHFYKHALEDMKPGKN